LMGHLSHRLVAVERDLWPIRHAPHHPPREGGCKEAATRRARRARLNGASKSGTWAALRFPPALQARAPGEACSPRLGDGASPGPARRSASLGIPSRIPHLGGPPRDERVALRLLPPPPRTGGQRSEKR